MSSGPHDHPEIAAEASSRLTGDQQLASAIAALQLRVAKLETGGTTPPDPVPPTYDGIFQGANGGNQGANFAAFVKANPGAHLAVKGIVTCAGTRTKPAILIDTDITGMTIDFLAGARLQATAISYGILNYPGKGGTWNDLEVAGTGYDWVGAEDPDGVEDAIALYGGRGVTFNRPVLHDNRGDGIYIGSGSAGIKVTAGKLYRNARNGIGQVAGDLSFIGGSIDQSGLHNIDLEPNNDPDGATISLTASGLRLTKHDNLPQVAGSGYAIGGEWGGGAGAMKIKLDVQGCSADRFRVAVSNIKTLVFKGNSSDTLIDGGSETLEFLNCLSKDPATVALFNAANTNIRNPKFA